MELFKLYAQCPDGFNRIFEVTESGGFNDKTKILHDERVHGPMPQEFIDADMDLAKKQIEAQKKQAINMETIKSAVSAKLVASAGLTQDECKVLFGQVIQSEPQPIEASTTIAVQSDSKRTLDWVIAATAASAAAAGAALYHYLG